MHNGRKSRHLSKYFLVAGVLFFFLMTAGNVAGKSCDQALTPFPGSQLGYKPLVNRCEGFYVSNVSSGSLEVVSLIRGRLNFEWHADVVLEVTTPSADVKPVKIRAVAIPLKTYYRMDSELAPGEKLIWPIRDILHPGKLTADRLGVFGWIGEEGDKEFFPLHVKQIAPSESRPPQETELTYLVVRSSVDTASFLWRMSKRDEEKCLAFGGWQKIPEAPRHAGAPVMIRLPESENATEGICVEVAAKERQSDDWLKLSVRIHM